MVLQRSKWLKFYKIKYPFSTLQNQNPIQFNEGFFPSTLEAAKNSNKNTQVFYVLKTKQRAEVNKTSDTEQFTLSPFYTIRIHKKLEIMRY